MPAADAANHDARVVGAIGLRQRDVGYEIAHILDGVDALRLHCLGVDGHDGQRQVLEIFLATPGGDDNLFQHSLGGCALSRSLLPR